MSASFVYRLTGTGWSECELTIDGAQIQLTASYTSDALRELLIATNLILGGNHEARATFDEEPGEYRWRLSRITENRLRIRIIWFEEVGALKPDVEGKLLFEANCGMKPFGQAVLDGCRQLVSELGTSSYARKWARHPFPESDVNELVALLRRFEPPAPRAAPHP
jgi:hypothetical protein